MEISEDVAFGAQLLLLLLFLIVVGMSVMIVLAFIEIEKVSLQADDDYKHFTRVLLLSNCSCYKNNDEGA